MQVTTPRIRTKQHDIHTSINASNSYNPAIIVIESLENQPQKAENLHKRK